MSVLIPADVIDELPQDVEAYLDREESIAAPDAEAARPEDHYTPPAVDLPLALRLMRRLGRIRHNAAAHTAALRVERDLIDRAIAEIEAVAERRAAPIEDLLRLFHRSVLSDDPKRKTVSLAPYGTLSARSVGPQPKVVNEALTLSWAKQGAPDCVRSQESLDWARLKKSLIDTGEVVPGVEWQPERTDFSVKPEEAK